MLREIKDIKDRCACYVDAETGIVEHEYKKVKTTTTVAVGSEMTIKRDTTVTILKRVSPNEFEVEKYNLFNFPTTKIKPIP